MRNSCVLWNVFYPKQNQKFELYLLVFINLYVILKERSKYFEERLLIETKNQN